MARSMFVGLFRGPRVQNVCGDPFAFTRDVLFTSGRRVFFLRGQSQLIATQ